MRKSSYCLTVSFPQNLYEHIIARCYLLGMAGCEEQAAHDRMTLKVFFSSESEARHAADKLADISGLTEDSLVQVEDQDWLAKWRESMKPAQLANGFWVSPAWLVPPAAAKHWIKIEPKMAFGTGHHETTRLASGAIIANGSLIRGKNLLDIGCGSGVLCFVADICGAESCVGVEIDTLCRENLAENRDGNPISGKVMFCIGTLSTLKDRARFDVVVMNMLIRESAPLLDRISSLHSSAGMLIWSGILDSERDEAIGFAGSAGFALNGESSENEWWCGVFGKKDRG